MYFTHTQVHERQATQRKIVAAIAEDVACRRPGVTDGLYGLEHLAPFARLGHGAPTIRQAEPTQFRRAISDAEFRERLHHAAPFVAGLDWQSLGLRLAGGAASALLMRPISGRGGPALGEEPAFHDFDLFLVGHPSDAAAKAAIEALGRHLHRQWGAAREMTVYRTHGCITFHVNYSPDSEDLPGPYLVQVILRRYSTVGEVIHGFDLGSSAVLWDGERVILTGLGKFAAEHGANILNLAARRASYEHRLARYFKRGFDLVLPELNGCDFGALRGRLPYLNVHGFEVGDCPCFITADALGACRPSDRLFLVGGQCAERMKGGGEPDASGGEPGASGGEPDAVDNGPCNSIEIGRRERLERLERLGIEVEACKETERALSDYAIGQIAYGDKLAITRRNASTLGETEIRVANLCAYGAYTADLDIFTLEPCLDPEIFEIAVMRGGWDSRGWVNIRLLRDVLGPDRTAELVLQMIGERAQRPSIRMIESHCRERAVELNAKAILPFAFMRVEDRTALTGPFPRELVTASDWYGAAHRLL
jgi:hypothetical protein